MRTARYGGVKRLFLATFCWGRFKAVLDVNVGLGAFVMTLMNNRIPYLAIFLL
jgi:hypothetical protein